MRSAGRRLATSTFTSSCDEKRGFQTKLATFGESERVLALCEVGVGSYEKLSVELVRLVKRDLSNRFNVNLLELSASKLLDLPEPPIERQLENDGPVV